MVPLSYQPVGHITGYEYRHLHFFGAGRIAGGSVAAEIVQDTRRAAGRPSLTGLGKHSPQVSARVPPELRDAAERQARREGKSVSQLIRELLGRYLTGNPGGVRG